MNAKKEKTDSDKVEEPATVYESLKLKQQGSDRPTFDFDEEFKKGYTPEQFKEEMFKRIKAYPWKK